MDFDVATLTGRTIVSAEVVQEEYSEMLQLVLDDGRTIHVGGYSDVFTNDDGLTVVEK